MTTEKQKQEPLFYYIDVAGKHELLKVMGIVYEELNHSLHVQYARSLHFGFTLKHGYVYGAEIVLEYDAAHVMKSIVDRIHREVEHNRISWEWDGTGKAPEPRQL